MCRLAQCRDKLLWGRVTGAEEQHSRPTFFALPRTHTCTSVSSPRFNHCAHSGGFQSWSMTRRSPVCSVSCYLQPEHQCNGSQRRIPVFPLKSKPDQSKLLACQQHSFRPSGHPLAFPQSVPLPVIPVVGYLSKRPTITGSCSAIRVYLPTLWETVDEGEIKWGYNNRQRVGEGGRERGTATHIKQPTFL